MQPRQTTKARKTTWRITSIAIAILTSTMLPGLASAVPSSPPRPSPSNSEPTHAPDPASAPASTGIPTPSPDGPVPTMRVLESTPPAPTAQRTPTPLETPTTLKIPASPPTIGHAAEKMVGEATNVWGAFTTTTPLRVWTEVRVGSAWLRDQSGTTSATGSFVLPLVHGRNTAVVWTYRVAAQFPGQVQYSPVFSVRRFKAPVASSAGVKVVRQGTNTWGTMDTRRALRVWSEVDLGGGRWSRSQVRTTTPTGEFVIPLTYGSGERGVRRWRIAAEYTPGYVVRSQSFPLRRVSAPTAATAGRKPIGQATNIWGRFDTARALTVRTEVRPASGWSRSQVRTTSTTGGYAIPLTYGVSAPGTWTFRVVAQYPEGALATGPVTLTRLPSANAVITRTTAQELAGHHTASCPMAISRLRTIRVNYWDYSGTSRRGVIIVRDDTAAGAARAFTKMYNARFRIAQMRLPGEWSGSDTRMMAANNTSGYNCRKVVGNPYRWSPHAYGYAVDINPVQNPYRDPTGRWWPSNQWSTRRPPGVPGMHYSTSTSVTALKAEGWSWFSGWDWHHFEKK